MNPFHPLRTVAAALALGALTALGSPAMAQAGNDTLAKIRSSGNGGYTVTFSGYPTLDAGSLSLATLLPPPVTFDGFGSVQETVVEDPIQE